MAQLDPALSEPTPTGAVAGRADAYLIAVGLMRRAEVLGSASADDVLALAQFLAGDDL